MGRVLLYKTGGDTVRSVAKGWKPPRSKRFQEVERKATILGGIAALAAIGKEPWVNFDLSEIPPITLKKDKAGEKALALAQRGASALRERKPRDLTQAAEFVRKKVKEEGLGPAAWYARAMYMTGTGSIASAKRAKVEAKVASVTGGVAKGLAGAAAATGPTIVGPLVLGTAAAITEAASWVMLTFSARSKVEETRSKLDQQKHANDFEKALARRSIRKQKKELEAMQRQLNAAQAAQEAIIAKEADMISKVIVGASFVVTLGGLGMLTYLVVRRFR